MSNNATTAKKNGLVGLEGIDAHREIKRIADAVIARRVVTAQQLTDECADIAHEHYVTIEEVYKKVWPKVEEGLHPTHPAGKTEAYHTLRERALR